MTEPLLRHLVGEQLRLARLQRGETLKQVAERAGVSTPYLSEVERGRKEPSSEILSAITGSLETSLLDLTRGVTERLTPSSTVSQGDFRLAA
jgi:transcriptional regulator with XRE-family HTH domain